MMATVQAYNVGNQSIRVVVKSATMFWSFVDVTEPLLLPVERVTFAGAVRPFAGGVRRVTFVGGVR